MPTHPGGPEHHAAVSYVCSRHHTVFCRVRVRAAATVPPDVDCGDATARRERRDLPRPSEKKRAGGHEHCVRRFLVKPGKLRVDLLACARLQDKQLLPKHCRGIARVT